MCQEWDILNEVWIFHPSAATGHDDVVKIIMWHWD